MTTQAEVIIVGGGPAGLSTALHLVQQDAAWAGRILVLEKARYPRPKLCGGGITRPGLDVLAELGLTPALSTVPMQRVLLRYRQRTYFLEGDPVFTVVHRPEFDAWLAQEARARGIVIQQDAGVTQVQVHDAGVRVQAGARTYQARALVAADGSNSVVRRQLRWGAGHKARLLEIFTPGNAADEHFRLGHALFDWTPLDGGVQGYYWTFPGLVAGQPMLNRGLFDAGVLPQKNRPSLKKLLAQCLARDGLNLADYQLKGHPIHWWTPDSQLARNRVLLVGDAAGVDPFLGEGIAFALGYGQVAAQALVAAHRAQDYSFGDYTQRVRQHWLTQQLHARYLGARLAFGTLRWPLLTRALWWAAPPLFRTLAAVRPQYFPLDKKEMLRG